MKVSIFCVAYNHESFIAEALDSFLMQKTDFDYEIVVGEDCSTDHTREILITYRERYPDKIRLLLHPENIGMMNNFIVTLKACRGKYVALCEGDDFWTDPFKLQKQVDLMEANPSCSFSFHQVSLLNEEKDILGVAPVWESAQAFSIEDLIIDWRINTCSVVFRNDALTRFDMLASGIYAADYALCLTLALKGPYYYIPQNMAVYRRHTGGITQTGILAGEKAVEQMKKLFSVFNRFTHFQYAELVKKKILLAYISYFSKTAGSLNLFLRQKLKCRILWRISRDAPGIVMKNFRLVLGDVVFEKSLKGS